MRLGLISAKYPFGPQEPYLDTELRALAPGLERVVIVPASPETATRGFDDVPATVVRLPVVGARTVGLALAAFARRPARVFAALAAIVGDRYPRRVKLKNLAVFAKGLAVAEIARRERLEHLHAYWLSTPATVAWIAARVAGIPFSATAHRWDIYENNLAARKVREAVFVRTVSERGRRDLLARAGGDPAKIVVVRVGVALRQAQHDTGARGDRAAMASPALTLRQGSRGARLRQDDTGGHGDGGALRILCAAALVPVKGHDVLLKALAALRGRGVAFSCVLAGEGPLRAEITREIEAAGLGAAVVLAGRVPHEELLARLGRGDFDASVIASVERGGGLMEGVPVALIEAMAAGTPVVASDSGSIGELVDGTTGLLVPAGDPEALAAALERLAREPGLADRLRGAGRAFVEHHFDVACTTARLRALLTRRDRVEASPQG